MINPINTSASVSYVMQALETQKGSDTNSKIKKTSLPVIATLGNQARAVGDSANPAMCSLLDCVFSGPSSTNMCCIMHSNVHTAIFSLNVEK